MVWTRGKKNRKKMGEREERRRGGSGMKKRGSGMKKGGSGSGRDDRKIRKRDEKRERRG